jgi:Protein of unknown function (DUF2752)
MLNIFRSAIYKRILIVTGLSGIVGLYWYFNPMDVLFPKCPVFSLTGMYCPGCGSQRALHAFLHANLAEAFRQNLLATVCYFAILAEMLLLIAGNRQSRPSYWLKHTRYAALSVLFAVLFFTLLRNIPVYPFTLLAPFH